MSTCSACGAALVEGAAFCPACGKSTSAQGQTAGSSVDTARVRQAAVQAHSAVMSLGTEKLTYVAGGLLGAIGALLPFYSIPSDSMLGDVTGGSPSLVGQGGVGMLVLALAIVLGGAPLLMTLTRVMSLAGFGLAAAVIGLLIGHRTMSFMGQTMPLDFGVGYYLVFLGFAVLVYAYCKRSNAS